MSRRIPAEALLVLCVVLWGLNFTAVKIGVESMPPLLYADLRFGGAGLLMLAVLRLRRERLTWHRRDLPLFVVAAFVGTTLGQIAFVYAMSTTTASDTALLQATIPIFTAVCAVAVGSNQISRRLWISLTIGLLGVVLIVRGAPISPQDASSLTGDALALATALAFAIYSVLIARLMATYSAYQVSTWIMLLAGAFLLPGGLASAASTTLATIPGDGWLSLAFSTIGAVVVTNLLYFAALHQVGAPRANLFLYLESFVGALFAVLLLGEHVSLVQLVGGAVVIASVILGSRRAGTEAAEEPILPAA
jgi:drug/metabolite transporter (DMT)-like permease